MGRFQSFQAFKTFQSRLSELRWAFSVVVYGRKSDRKHTLEIRLGTLGEFNSIPESSLRFLRLLDHPIRSRQHVRRDRQSDLFCCSQVNNEVKLGRRLHRDVAWMGALENLIDEECGAVILRW
jgi:hypothetical protein